MVPTTLCPPLALDRVLGDRPKDRLGYSPLVPDHGRARTAWHGMRNYLILAGVAIMLALFAYSIWVSPG
jgi:hypothetical protein